MDWYLSVNLEHKRDVIERGVEGSLDISGWDLRKALRLLQKSNPALRVFRAALAEVGS